MKCHEVVQILRDGGVPDAASRQHLSACESCAREEAFWRHARGALSEAPSQPPFLHARIMAAVRAESREREENHIWFQIPWIRRWALPAATAALVVLGEGYSMMAFFSPAPDDLVVRWSEQEAILLAQNGTPVSPFGDAYRAPAEKVPSVGGPGRPAQAEAEGRDLPGRLPQPSVAPTFAPVPDMADGKLAARRGDADEVAVSAPFEMAKAREAEGGETYGIPGAYQPQAPSPAAPATRANEELAKKDDSKSSSGAVDGPAKAKGSAEPRARSEAPAPELNSVPGQAAEPTVACRILSAGAPVRRLDLPAALAPPPGIRWPVTVDAGGRLVSAGGGPGDPERVKALQLPIGGLHLPQGAYILTR